MDVTVVNKPFCLAVCAEILDEQGRCLLLKRSAVSRHFAGTWEWPGGKPEKGETFDVALHREVAEETGLEINLSGVAGAFHYEMNQRHVVMLCMEAYVTGGSLHLSEEHDESAWVSLTDLLNWKLSDWFREFVDNYIAGRRTDQ